MCPLGETETINEKILESILKLLKDRHITEKECLVQTNINTNFFSAWKSKKTKSPSIDNIYRIATFLDVSIDFLITGDKNSIKITPNSGINDSIVINARDMIKDKLSGDERSLINTYKEVDETGKMKMLDSAKTIWADHRQPECKSSNSEENTSQTETSYEDKMIG